MTALIDTGFLYATLDKGDVNHRRVAQLLPSLTGELILPAIVLVELSYLVQARIPFGHQALQQFLQQLYQSSIRLEALKRTDLPRIEQLLKQYEDAQLDFVDAALVTIAERLDVQRILTVDQRDFRMIRPLHCEYFEILP